jgi:long-chain fatty acid transport protein
VPAVALAAVAGLCGGEAAQAAGFAILEQGASGLGRAYAGMAAVADDPSTIFYNPAGMTRLRGTQATAAAHLIMPSIRFRDQGSFVNLPSRPPLRGGEGGNAAEAVVVPNLYAVTGITDRLHLGLGINAPFGLVTDYEPGWVGRYHAQRSDLVTINVNPSLAYRVTDWLSVGGGVSAQYAKAELSNAIDFGLLINPALSQTLDGAVKLKGDGWAFGWNLGVLVEPMPGTRFGLAYRAAMNHELKGDAEFTVPTPAVQAGGRFVDTGVRADLDLPDMLSFSAYHQLTPRLGLLGDITWTRWSRFQELRIRFDNPLQPDAVTTHDWDDAFRYSLGLDYRLTDAWTLRAGVAYDETPIPRTELRTARIPDANRTWLTIGASYRLSPMISVDAGFAHIFVDRGSIRQSQPATAGTLVGEYRSHVDIVSLQANIRF